MSVNPEKLVSLRNEVQSWCYYHREGHGACKERNGSGRLCSFCEIVEKIDKILKG